jgi:hypothetical protein
MKSEIDHADDVSAFKDEKIEYDLNSLDNEQVIDKNSDTKMHIEEFQFTWRASIIGSLLGCLVGKSFVID